MSTIKPQQRIHHRFSGRLPVKVRLVAIATEQTEAELNGHILNASFTGAKVTIESLTPDQLERLSQGQLVARFSVPALFGTAASGSMQSDSFDLDAGVPVWNTTAASGLIIGVTWRADADPALRVRLIEMTHQSDLRPAQPTSSPTLVFGVVAVAVALLIGWQLFRSKPDQVSTKLAPAGASATVARHAAHVVSHEMARGPVLKDSRWMLGFADENSAGAPTANSWLSTPMTEGPLLKVNSIDLSGSALTIQVAPLVVLPEGTPALYGNIFVSDANGNTIDDCSFRDRGFVGEQEETLQCQLPADAVLPLHIAGTQLRHPSFIEPSIAAGYQVLFDEEHPAEPSKFAVQ